MVSNNRAYEHLNHASYTVVNKTQLFLPSNPDLSTVYATNNCTPSPQEIQQLRSHGGSVAGNCNATPGSGFCQYCSSDARAFIQRVVVWTSVCHCPVRLSICVSVFSKGLHFNFQVWHAYARNGKVSSLYATAHFLQKHLIFFIDRPYSTCKGHIVGEFSVYKTIEALIITIL